MKIEQKRWTKSKGWEPNNTHQLSESAQLVLLFGSTQIFKDPITYETIHKRYPKADLLGCSTAGEIFGTNVSDDSMVLTAIEFTHTTIKGTSITIDSMKDSFHAGEKLIQTLDKENLVHIFVLSDGLNVNGSDLVRGISKHLPSQVTITGGLSGDGSNFKETYVLWNKPAAKNTVAIIGFYGKKMKIGYSSLGGWDAFGPDRIITRSEGNILYELDGQSALSLYKKYLGDHAKDLPASGLLFPLSIRVSEDNEWVVRTILAVNEENQSMVFAGDVPEGSYARLMKANFERLIDGAEKAAQVTRKSTLAPAPDLAILISCVGRKMILNQRIEEEVEAVRGVYTDKTCLAGFYSYGEISPFTPNARCELHNQTMTITTLSELA